MRNAMPQEQAAAKLLAAVKGGQSLADAAAVAGVTVRRTPLVTRGASADGMPPQLAQPLFGTEAGRADDGGDAATRFIVAVPAEIVEGRSEGRSGRLRSGSRRRWPARSAPISAPCSPMHCAPGRNRASISPFSTTSLVNQQ